MPIIKNNQLKELTAKKHNLLRSIERKEITEEEGKAKVRQLDIEIKILLDDFVDNEIQKVKEENKMAEEEKKETVKEVKPKRRREGSNTWLIVDAFTKKSTKNADDIVAKVKEKKPDADAAKLKSQVNALARIFEKGSDKRFSEYTFDKEAYLLVKKE